MAISTSISHSPKEPIRRLSSPNGKPRRTKRQVELDLLLRIKRAMNPKGIMNPGKGTV
jgi:FAD/FMN-containing dehydrogenase